MIRTMNDDEGSLGSIAPLRSWGYEVLGTGGCAGRRDDYIIEQSSEMNFDQRADVGLPSYFPTEVQ